MTINLADNNPRINYSVASGVTQTVFSVPFDFFESSDVSIYVDSILKTEGTDYTLTGGDGTTGNLTFVTATPPNVQQVTGISGGTTVSIVRHVALKRVTDFAAGQNINRASLNEQLDTIVAQVADLDSKVDRTIHLTDSELAPSMLLTSDRKGRVLAFDSTTGDVEAGPLSNDINTIANNITAILDASNQASAAASSATAASSSATAAQTAETNAELAETGAAASAATATTKANTATTKASEASASATNAATSESNAATSATSSASSATASEAAKTASEAAKDAALAALDSFDDRYLGQKAADPTLDNDGNALVAGALYFNTTTDIMKVYDGSAWLAAYASLSGALIATSNLSDVTDVAASRTNLGLGTAATTASSAYATAAQGTLANTATQPADLGTAAATAATDYATAAQGVKADAAVQATATTGQANLPSGTTAQRTATPATGALRFNSTDVSFEGYNGTEWGSIGGGAADGIFYENEQNVTSNYTIVATKNAMTAGPITIASGVSVTIETGGRWIVL